MQTLLKAFLYFNHLPINIRIFLLFIYLGPALIPGHVSDKQYSTYVPYKSEISL